MSVTLFAQSPSVFGFVSIWSEWAREKILKRSVPLVRAALFEGRTRELNSSSSECPSSSEEQEKEMQFKTRKMSRNCRFLPPLPLYVPLRVRGTGCIQEATPTRCICLPLRGSKATRASTMQGQPGGTALALREFEKIEEFL